MSQLWLKKVRSSTPVSSTARTLIRSIPLRMWARVGAEAIMAATQALSPGMSSEIFLVSRRSS